MVETLATFIKPAMPTRDVADMIVGNAKNWGHTTLVILEEHYRSTLDNLLKEVAEDWVTEWKPAFQVASKWARGNLNRITQEVIEHAEALIMTCEREEDGEQAPRQRSPSPALTPPIRRRRQRQEEDTRHIEEVMEVERESEREREREVEREEQPVATQPEQIQEGPPKSPRPPKRAVRPCAQKATVGTMTDQAIVWSLDNEGVSEGDLFSEAPSEEEEAPRPQRPKRRDPNPRTGNLMIMEDSELLTVQPFIEEGDGNPPGQTTPLDSFFEMDFDGTLPLTPIKGPPRGDEGVQHIQAQIHRVASLEELAFGDPEQEEERDTEVHTPIDPAPIDPAPLFRVNRHITTTRKMVDWGLTVRKKWLILGDSNISRFPGHAIPDLQIDCYPGAGFRHAEELMDKAKGNVSVEKLVLSFGINSREQQAKTTAVRQMQAMLRAAKRRFPYAQIWIPLINFSTELEKAQQQTLTVLNEHIQRNMPFIPKLPDDRFHTEEDNIHWTPETATAILDFWASKLNF